MKCPVCGSELVKGKQRRYETLLDHVSDPNGTSPTRDTYVCNSHPSETCPLDNVYDTIFWDSYGDAYIRDYGDIKAYNITELADDGILEAMSSPSRRNAMESKYREMAPVFKTPKWRFKWEIRRNFSCNEDGKIIKRKYDLQAFKKDKGDGYYCYYSGFWKMLFFSLGRFYGDLASHKKYGSSFDLQDYFEPLPNWMKKDNYRKVSHWYINTFYSKLKEENK